MFEPVMKKSWVWVCFILMGISMPVGGQTAVSPPPENAAETEKTATEQQEETDILSLSFEDLMKMEVVVSASKRAQPIDKSPTAINVLTAEDIRRSGAKTIPELLQRFPGVWSWTKTRTDQDISLMGFMEDENGKALFLIDGQNVLAPYLDGMHWPQLPITLEEVERIEIVRGGGSALYGSNALTGVVNIITKSAKTRKNTINSYMGEGGIHNHTYTWAESFDQLSLALTGGWRQTQNKGSSDPHNRGEQNYYSTPVLNAKLDYDISDNQKASFFSGYSLGDGAYGASPGELDIDRVKDWEHMLFQGGYTNTAWENTEINIKGQFYRVTQQNFRPYQAGCPEKYHITGDRGNLETVINSKVIPDHIITGGFNYQYTLAHSIGPVSNLAPGRKHDYNMYGFFFQDEYQLTDQLTLVGGGRYDRYDDAEDMLTGRGTFMYQIDDKNTLRFSAGNSYKRPGIYAYHYIVTWPGGWFKGNPDLKYQKAMNYEFEYRTRLIPDHVVKMEIFQSSINNILNNVYSYPGPQILINTSDNKYRIRGIIGEIEGSPIKDRLNWYANLTYFDPEDTTANLEMTDVPEYLFNAGVQYFPLSNLYISMDGHYQDELSAVDDPTITDNNSLPAGTSLRAYSTADVKVGYSPWENVEFSVSIENLFNDKHYEFPLHQERGRTLYAGVRVTW